MLNFKRPLQGPIPVYSHTVFTPTAHARPRLHSSCVSRTHATPHLSESDVMVAWSMQYRCKFGQSIAIVGGHERLGCWDPQKGMSLEWSEGDTWIGEAIFVPGTQMEYKYVVKGSEGRLCYWKPGTNATLQLQAPAGAKVVVMDTWDDSARKIEVQALLNGMVQQDAPVTAPPSESSPEGTGIRFETMAAIHEATTSKATESTPGAAESVSIREALESIPKVVLPIPEVVESILHAAESSPGVEPPPPAAMDAPPPPPPPPAASASMDNPLLQYAGRSMTELRDAMKLHEATQKRNQDPASLEVIKADRLLAAANNKAVALNKAIKAASDFPQLPSSAFRD